MKTVEPAKTLPRVWAVVFAVVLACAFLVLFLSKIARTPACEMSFVEESAPPVPGKPSPPPLPVPPEGSPSAALTVLDAGKKVLTYVYGDKLAPGIDPRYTKSSYIHPLYSLDGQILTEDFPRDHPEMGWDRLLPAGCGLDRSGDDLLDGKLA